LTSMAPLASASTDQPTGLSSATPSAGSSWVSHPGETEVASIRPSSHGVMSAPPFARVEGLEQLLQALVALQRLDHLADVLGAIARADEDRVTGVDHHQPLDPDHRDRLRAREHHAVAHVDQHRLALGDV